MTTENSVVCGDALDFLRNLQERPQLILTDIPYGEVNRKSNGLRNLDKSYADIVDFDLEELANLFVDTTLGTLIVFCGTEQVSTLRRIPASRKMSTRLCVFKKKNPSPMNCQHLYLSDLEACIYAKKPKATFNGSYLSSCWEFPISRNKHHPTEKPLKLMRKLIEECTDYGDLVVDPFCGGGSTLVAAKELGRRYLGCDKNPTCVDVSKKRLADVTD